MFRLQRQTPRGNPSCNDILQAIIARGTAALFMIAVLASLPSSASADARAMTRYAAICNDLSQTPAREWRKRLEANGFSPAPADLAEARLRDMFLVQVAHLGQAVPPAGQIDAIVASDMKKYFNPGRFIKVRRGPKEAYSNGDGVLFLVGTITNREYLGKSRAGLIGCDIITGTWMNKSRATSLAADVTGVAKSAVRNNSGSPAHYQVVAHTVPEPPLVKVKISAVRSKGGYPAFTQLEIEHTADLIN